MYVSDPVTMISRLPSRDSLRNTAVALRLDHELLCVRHLRGLEQHGVNEIGMTIETWRYRQRRVMQRRCVTSFCRRII